jgi:hypothetical protein
MQLFKNLSFLIFRYYLPVLFIFCILLFFFKIIPFAISCQRETNRLFIDSGIFSINHLNDFYVPKKSVVDNIRKFCFSEGIGAIHAWMIELQLVQYDKPIDLRRIIGKQCYENFKKFSKCLMESSQNLSEIDLFLTAIFDKQNTSYIYNKYNSFFIEYQNQFGREWHPKQSFSREVAYFASFWTVEELAPLSIPNLFNMHDSAVNSLKFFKCVEKNNVWLINYTNYGKKLLKNFFTINDQDLSKIYKEADSYFFNEQTGDYTYKLKHALPHLHGLRRFYADKIVLCMSGLLDFGFEENCGTNFFSIYDYLENHIRTYEEILREIEAMEIINHILYYPSVSTGKYYLEIAVGEVRDRLELNSEAGVFRNTNNFVYVEFPYGDIRIRRLIKKYLNWIYKAGYLKDEKIIENYKKHARIFCSILIDGKDLIETEELTYEEAVRSINFIKKIIEIVAEEEEILSRKCFFNIDEIRKKKLI